MKFLTLSIQEVANGDGVVGISLNLSRLEHFSKDVVALDSKILLAKRIGLIVEVGILL
jgi:hypothetical protein